MEIINKKLETQIGENKIDSNRIGERKKIRKQTKNGRVYNNPEEENRNRKKGKLLK